MSAKQITLPQSSIAVLKHQLGTTWISTTVWALGLISVCLLYLSLYPSMEKLNLEEMMSNFPQALSDAMGYNDIATGAGYTQSTVFGLLGFVMLAVAGISWGASAIGGANQDGSLELTLAHSVSRISYGIQSIGAILIRLLFLGGLTGLTVMALNQPGKLSLEIANVWAVVFAWVGLAVLLSLLSLAIGALTGSRSIALGVGGAVTAAAYLFQAIAKTADHLDWLSNISPYTWAYGNAPLTHGFDTGGLLLLWIGAALFGAAAIYLLQKRDVSN